ncbi:MAG: hypothetical protein QM500_07425 [Methylococcales bacterium]
MELYNCENLTKNIGAKVSVRDEHGGCVELTVSEVNTCSIDGDEWEAFTVIYQAEEGIQIEQGVYTFNHDCFGAQQFFLAPNSSTEYETVISRKKEA